MVGNLQKQYVQQIGGKVKDGDKDKVTASMGIAIGHHLTPLSIVRRAATDAEKLAKNHYGRNSLVVTILRRSGEQTRVGCRWYYTEPDKPNELSIKPIALFKNFYQYFVCRQLSPKSIHVLLDEASTLVGLEACAQISEIKRVLKRQSSDQEPKRLKDDVIERLATNIVQLACAMDKTNLDEKKQRQELSIELHSDGLRYGLVEVFGWLLVMAFLAREGLKDEDIS